MIVEMVDDDDAAAPSRASPPAIAPVLIPAARVADRTGTPGTGHRVRHWMREGTHGTAATVPTTATAVPATTAVETATAAVETAAAAAVESHGDVRRAGGHRRRCGTEAGDQRHTAGRGEHGLLED